MSVRGHSQNFLVLTTSSTTCESAFHTLSQIKLILIVLAIIYSARRLMGSQLIESAAYCNQTWLAKLYINSAQNTLVNWIIQLLVSILCQPKVIPLSDGHCNIRFHIKLEKKLLQTSHFIPGGQQLLCVTKCHTVEEGV